MSILAVPGAHLYYETRGSGPLLLLIPGANGDARVFPPLAERLSRHYTVLTYDRRGFSRSRLDGPQDYARRLIIDAEDAQRLIRHHGDGRATVFGTSSGAVVALQLLLDHPEVTQTIVPYEPSMMRLLVDGQSWLDFFHELYDLYRESGTAPALAAFRERTFAATDRAVMDRASNPENGPHVIANATYWFERELCEYTAIDLDRDVLLPRANQVVPAVGWASHGFPTYQAGVELGRVLRRPVVELPGGHVGYATDADAFADELINALSRPRITPADQEPVTPGN